MAQHNYYYKFCSHAIYDYHGLQSELEGMAEKGWRLDRATGYGLWRYRAAEPKRVRYEITYVSAASSEQLVPTEDELEMEEYCAAAGWEKAASLAQMQIYCNEAPDAVPLETDEVARLRSIQASMKKNYWPNHFILLGLMAFQLVLRLSLLLRNPVETLTSRADVYLLGLVSWALVSAVVNLVLYALWSVRSEQAVVLGLPCVSQRSYRWARRIFMACSGAILLGMVWVWPALASALLIGAILVLVIGIEEYTAWQKKAKKSSTAGILMAVVVPLLLMGMVIASPAFHFQPNSNYIADEPENMIVTLEELTGAPSGSGHEIADMGTTPFASSTFYHQDWSGKMISYSVYELKTPLFRDACVESVITGFREWKYNLNSPDPVEADPGRWNAEQVWHCEDDGYDRWLIIYETRVVSFTADWVLVEDQLAILAEAFAF